MNVQRTLDQFATATASITDMPRPSLKQLVERAIAAQDAMRVHLATVDNFPAGQWPDAYCHEQDRLDREFDRARDALSDHLLFEHKIGTALAARIGEVLP